MEHWSSPNGCHEDCPACEVGHSPAPWKAEGWNGTVVNDADGNTLALYPGAGSAQTAAANAALIAAAPDLLAIAELLHLSINGLHATLRATNIGYRGTELCRQMDALIRDNAAAIAKARG
jgi:hypothetical protein